MGINLIIDEIKSYPKEFYDSKLRKYIRLCQIVLTFNNNLVKDNNGIFWDLLIGDLLIKMRNLIYTI